MLQLVAGGCATKLQVVFAFSLVWLLNIPFIMC